MKKISVMSVIPILMVIVADIYKFNFLSNKDGYSIDGNKIISGLYVVCDEDLNRYENEKKAKEIGLKPQEYEATYCPEYKMHPSWDINKDGINDCYETNSCDKSVDYTLPR